MKTKVEITIQVGEVKATGETVVEIEQDAASPLASRMVEAALKIAESRQPHHG